VSLRAAFRSPVAAFTALPAATRISLLGLLAWALLASLAFRLIPFARHGWAFNLSQYLPPSCAPVFAGLALTLCSASVRRALIAMLGSATGSLAALISQKWLRGIALFTLSTALFWLLREREDFGDSVILMWSVVKGRAFHFPDVGSTFLFAAFLRMGGWLFGDLDSAVAFLRLSVCLCGGAFVLLMLRAGRYLVPGRPALAACLVAAGGLLRIFAGHGEVYGYLFVALAAFLWFALAYLEGDRRLESVAFVMGIAIWLHASSVFLSLGLFALWRWGRPGIGAPNVRLLLRALGWAAVPYAVFLVVGFALGAGPAIVESFGALLGSLRQGSADQPLHVLIRLPGQGETIGTDYVLLSLGHLKYLLNASHLLAPAALPLLLASALCWPRVLGALATGPRGRFLLGCLLPLIFYSLVLRPVWGPYDWDLFAITAFFAMALAVVSLDAALDAESFDHASVCIVGFTLLFVTLPFLATAVATPRAAGPFTHGHPEWQAETARGRPHPDLAPWL